MWTYNNGGLPKNVKIPSATTLVIKKIDTSNKGIYECEGITEKNEKFFASSMVQIIG